MVLCACDDVVVLGPWRKPAAMEESCGAGMAWRSGSRRLSLLGAPGEGAAAAMEAVRSKELATNFRI